MKEFFTESFGGLWYNIVRYDILTNRARTMMEQREIMVVIFEIKEDIYYEIQMGPALSSLEYLGLSGDCMQHHVLLYGV